MSAAGPIAIEPRVEAWERRAEWPLAVLALVFLAAYAIDVLASGLPAGWHHACQVADLVIWALFIADYAVRLGLARHRTRYGWRHLGDLAILVLPILRPLRILRLVVLLRALNRRATHSLRGQVVAYAVGAAVLLVFSGALAALDAERDAPTATIRTFGQALWWAVVTVSSVGYGDRVPVTTEGRLVATGLIVGGVVLIGAVTASFASWLIERVRDLEEVDQAATRRDLHAVHAQLDRMEHELGELKALLRAERAERPQGVERPASASS